MTAGPPPAALPPGPAPTRMSYLAVLRIPHVRPVLASALLTRLAFAAGPLALILLVQTATGSFAWAGAATAATTLTSGLLAPARGRLVDRYGQRRTLPPFAGAYAAALAGVVLVAGPERALAAVVLAAVAGAVVPPVGPAMRVLWATLAGRGPALQTAYALDAVLEEVVYIGGPLVAAALAGAAGPGVGLLAAAALALLGTLSFVVSRAARTWGGGRAGPAGWVGALAGRGLPTLVVSLAGVGAAIGIWDIAMVAAARGHGVAAAGGVLLAVEAAGSAAGGLWYGSRHWRRPAGDRYCVLLAGLAVTSLALPAAATWSLVAVGGLLAVVGLLHAPVMSSAYVLAAELAPEGTLTEAASWVQTGNVAAAAGMALAGAMVDQAGVAWAFGLGAAAATAALVVALAGWAVLRPPWSRPTRT
jgi:Major Facilitator Superfamily